jgi:hypothetical protein
MLRLIKTNQFPKGGWIYTQPTTGMQFGGNESFLPQVRKIVTHRKANGLPGATIEEASQDLVNFTCARFPSICVEGVAPIVVTVSPQRYIAPTTRKTGKCGSCGGRKKR